MAEKVPGRRVDVLVNPQEPRANDLDPEFLLQFPGQRGRGFFAGHEVAAEGVPHAGEADRAGPFPQEDSPLPEEESRRGHMQHCHFATRSWNIRPWPRYSYLTITSLGLASWGEGAFRRSLPKIQGAVLR